MAGFGMGLLNVGVREGPLVIQLFGRGVRLKGANMSLKRGGDGNPPPNLALLETMNIFGVRANFIARFREMLEREGVWEETIHLPTSPPMPEGLNAELQMPKHSGKEFTPAGGAGRDGKYSRNCQFVVVRPADCQRRGRRKQRGRSRAGGRGTFQSGAGGGGLGRTASPTAGIPRARGIVESVFSAGKPAGDFARLLRLCLRPGQAAGAGSRRDIRRIRDAAVAAMKKYARKFHSARRGEWELERIEYQPLKEEHPNFPEPGAAMFCASRRRKRKLLRESANWSRARKNWPPCGLPIRAGRGTCRRAFTFPATCISRCCCAGAETKEHSRLPPGLNEGEAEFVNKLRERLHDDQLKDAEIFLLRNASQTGLGFHGESGGVYPDFILWIKRGKKQRVVFIEPHGMVFADAHDDDPKARLYETLKPVIHKLKDERPDVKMDAFVVSRTPYETLRRKYGKGWSQERFKDCHILFAEDDYIARILEEKE